MDPDAIDRVVRKYAAELGLDRGYSAHSMRATFIATALENGAQLEDVQRRPPVTATPARRSSMTAADTIQRRRQASSTTRRGGAMRAPARAWDADNVILSSKAPQSFLRRLAQKPWYDF
jgi:hypothetical protein